MRVLALLASTILTLEPAIAACDNGINWTTADQIQRGNWQTVTHGGGLFVALGRDGAIMTSPDGDVWTAQAAPNENDWADIVYADGRFVAVSWDRRRPIITSSDGLNWKEIKLSSSDGFGSIAHGNGVYVAVGYDIREGIATSPDGENWSVAEITPGFMNGGAVTFADGRFVLIAASEALVSTDGQSWEQVGEGDMEGLWQSIAYGNDRFVAAGGSDGAWKLTVSTDGRNWSGVPDQSEEDVEFFEGWFFQGNGVTQSKDGITWARTGTAPERWLNHIAYDGQRFAGVGRDYAAYGFCAP